MDDQTRTRLKELSIQFNNSGFQTTVDGDLTTGQMHRGSALAEYYSNLHEDAVLLEAALKKDFTKAMDDEFVMKTIDPDKKKFYSSAPNVLNAIAVHALQIHYTKLQYQ
jgi:hypothetical protein